MQESWSGGSEFAVGNTGYDVFVDKIIREDFVRLELLLQKRTLGEDLKRRLPVRPGHHAKGQFLCRLCPRKGPYAFDLLAQHIRVELGLRTPGNDGLYALLDVVVEDIGPATGYDAGKAAKCFRLGLDGFLCGKKAEAWKLQAVIRKIQACRRTFAGDDRQEERNGRKRAIGSTGYICSGLGCGADVEKFNIVARQLAGRQKAIDEGRFQ